MRIYSLAYIEAANHNPWMLDEVADVPEAAERHENVGDVEPCKMKKTKSSSSRRVGRRETPKGVDNEHNVVHVEGAREAPECALWRQAMAAPEVQEGARGRVAPSRHITQKHVNAARCVCHA